MRKLSPCSHFGRFCLNVSNATISKHSCPVLFYTRKQTLDSLSRTGLLNIVIAIQAVCPADSPMIASFAIPRISMARPAVIFAIIRPGFQVGWILVTTVNPRRVWSRQGPVQGVGSVRSMADKMDSAVDSCILLLAAV